VIQSGVAWSLTLAAAALYMTTLRDLRRLQPNYPSRIVLTISTPPRVFVRAHLLFPFVAAMGTIAIGGVALLLSRGDKPRRRLQLTLFALHSMVMLAFIGIFGWATIWCERVFAWLGIPR
jgi:hypothetical protein